MMSFEPGQHLGMGGCCLGAQHLCLRAKRRKRFHNPAFGEAHLPVDLFELLQQRLEVRRDHLLEQLPKLRDNIVVSHVRIVP